jgi:hypothetical protein
MADTDYLAPLSPQQVAAWYGRAADAALKGKVGGKPPLAGQLLRHWLDNRDSKSVHRFEAPAHLRTSPHVTEALRFHRRVFLTEEKARFTGGRQAWAGIIPRIQGLTGFTAWDMSSPLELNYESLVEIGGTATEMARIKLGGSDEEKDLFAALRGFQLRSRVTVESRAHREPGRALIYFKDWFCRVKDRYDWDPDKKLTVDNPDFGSRDPGAVRPQDKELTVFHSNAIRIQDAKLAAPYDLESDEWYVGEAAITGRAEIDPTKKLD